MQGLEDTRQLQYLTSYQKQRRLSGEVPDKSRGLTLFQQTIFIAQLFFNFLKSGTLNGRDRFEDLEVVGRII
jgi:hypothetical protein